MLIKQKISSTLQLQQHLSLEILLLQQQESNEVQQKTLFVKHLKQVVAY
jgi:hypothetical protein